MTAYLILGMTYAFAAAVQPGPLLTFLISRTITNGWRRTIPAAFAPLLSDGPIIVLVLLVLNRMPGWLIQVLQIAGGVFILFLAFGAFKSWRNYIAKDVNKFDSTPQTVFKAIFVNILNPAPYLGWSLVMGPLLLKGWREAPVNGIALLVGFYVVLIFVTLGITLLFSAASKTGPQIGRILVGISAFALTFFGLYEIWLGTRGLS